MDAARPPWVRAVLDGREPAPVVLVLGGFLTSPPLYLALAGQLRALGAADVVVGKVWTMDWLLASTRGLGPVVTRSGRALLAASRRSAEVAGGAPVLVVGHSAGGMTARLLTSPAPFAGRRLGGAGRIGGIVTLGTPHVLAAGIGSWSRVAAETASFANSEVPGPCYAPTTAYLAVASRVAVGRRYGSIAERRTWAVYRELSPETPGDVVEGDGFVPLAAALLPGAPSVVLDGAAHGQGIGRDWYGSAPFVDQWWPPAIDAWRGALRARAAVARPAA